MSDDDVVIIGSSSESRRSPPQEPDVFNSSSNYYSEGEEDEHNSPHVHDGGMQGQRGPVRNLASGALQERLRSLPAVRSSADTQTDTSVVADTATLMHQHLMQLDTALGIRTPACAATAATTSVSQTAMQRVLSSWRVAGGQWKRNRRGESVPAEKTLENEPDRKRVREDGSCGTSVAAPKPASPPEWAEKVSDALQRCASLLQSQTFSCAAKREASEELRRAHLALPGSANSGSRGSSKGSDDRSTALQSHASPQEDNLARFMDARTPAANGAAHVADDAVRNDARSSVSPSPLLHEAALICARERTESLLPVYAELRALRREHAEAQAHQSRTTRHNLEWEQRLLSDVLAECDAQLEFMNVNFQESCKAGLAPLDALQRRMDALQAFRRQLEAAGAVTAPMRAYASTDSTAHGSSALPTRSAPRSQGPVAEVVTRHLAEERLQWQATVEALQAQLKDEQLRNAQLQSCYTHVTAQVQEALDTHNFVDKEAIGALKRQQQAQLAALAQQFGWVLVNSSPDVLSLRHPGTGEVLHANHTYSTINGKQCEDVATALAEYVVQHRHPVGTAATGQMKAAPPEPLSSESAAGAEKDPVVAPMQSWTGDSVPHGCPVPPTASFCPTPLGEHAGEERGDKEPSLPSPPSSSSSEGEPEGSGESTEASDCTSVPAEQGVAAAETSASHGEVSSLENGSAVENAEARHSDEDGSEGCHQREGTAEVDEVADDEGHACGSVAADEEEATAEEDAEESAELAEYSNVQSEEAHTASLRETREGSTADASASTDPMVTAPSVHVADAEVPPPSGTYTGFFSENNLWDDDA